MEKHSITWRGVEIDITYTPEKSGLVDHIELHTKDTVPLAVTVTGCGACFDQL